MTTPENPQSIMNERVELTNKMREIIEYYIANQLVIGLYEREEIKTEEEVDPTDTDTLARLERLSKQKSYKHKKRLIGAVFPLDIYNSAHLIVLFDGTVIKIKKPDDKIAADNYKRCFNIQSLSNEYLERKIKESPDLFFYNAEVVYRTDNPTLDNKQLEKMLEEDFRTAMNVAVERKRRIEQNQLTAQRTFVQMHNSEPKTPQEN